VTGRAAVPAPDQGVGGFDETERMVRALVVCLSCEVPALRLEWIVGNPAVNRQVWSAIRASGPLCAEADHPGMPFDFPSEQAFSFAEISTSLMTREMRDFFMSVS